MSDKLSSPLPVYVRVLAFALSWPLACAALVQWRAWSNRYAASARGAVMPRQVEHRLPGSVDLLMEMFESDRAAYLGEPSFEPCVILAAGLEWAGCSR